MGELLVCEGIREVALDVDKIGDMYWSAPVELVGQTKPELVKKQVLHRMASLQHEDLRACNSGLLFVWLVVNSFGYGNLDKLRSKKKAHSFVPKGSGLYFKHSDARQSASPASRLPLRANGLNAKTRPLHSRDL